MNNVKSMGVINITPDSFSDGNKYLTESSFSNQFNKLNTWANWIDIGAESTAPFNSKISQIQELERFEKVLFPFVARSKDPKTTLSIDTYKPEIFYEVYLFIKKYWPKTNIVFNDVSGCIDDDLSHLLSDTALEFDYIFSHNLVTKRDESSSHMDFAIKESSEQDLFLDDFFNYMTMGLALLKPFNRKVYIDPCFGFSKSREQNHILLAGFNSFLNKIPQEIPIVYGVSRKSFLRFPKSLDPKKVENQVIMDQMQAILFHKLINKNLNREILLRVHESSSIESALNINRIF